MKWIAIAWLLFVASLVAAADLGLARPILDVVNRVPWGDKVCHFLFVGGLCYLIGGALAKRRAHQAVPLIIGVMVAVAAVATLEEMSQLLFVERTFSFWDLASNYAGIGVFGCLAVWSRPKGEHRPPSSDVRRPDEPTSASV